MLRIKREKKIDIGVPFSELEENSVFKKILSDRIYLKLGYGHVSDFNAIILITGTLYCTHRDQICIPLDAELIVRNLEDTTNA
jgi:hypothetical protein